MRGKSHFVFYHQAQHQVLKCTAAVKRYLNLQENTTSKKVESVLQKNIGENLHDFCPLHFLVFSPIERSG
jgi:hypothetical protein